MQTPDKQWDTWAGMIILLLSDRVFSIVSTLVLISYMSV